MKLSVEAAKALQPGETLRDHDPKAKGLELRARAGVKSWHLYYRAADGTQRRPKIGEFPAISIEVARTVARDWLQRIAKGEDPSAERKEERHAKTVNDLMDYYLSTYAPREYAASTRRCVENLMQHYVRPEIGKVKVAALTVEDCNKLFARIANGEIEITDKFGKKRKSASKSNANSVRRYLAKALSLAEGASLQWRPRGTNPCHDEETTTYPAAKRRLHVRTDEFAALNKALRDLSASYPERVACIYCILLCGTRVTEMATARREWLHVDEFGTRELVLAEHKTADDVGDRRIFIPDAAARIMDGLPRHANGCIFGALADMKHPARAVWDVWNEARKAAGVRVELEARDLRRTFASVARTIGAGLTDIQPLLGHASAQTTEGYAYLFEDEKRKLAENTAERIGGLLEGKKE